MGELAAALGWRDQVEHARHEHGAHRAGDQAGEHEQQDQLPGARHPGAGEQQGETQCQQHHQRALALQPIEPGCAGGRAQRRGQGGAASDVADVLGGHAQFADEIRAERHHHHQAADRQHVDQHGQLDGLGRSRIHRLPFAPWSGAVW